VRILTTGKTDSRPPIGQSHIRLPPIVRLSAAATVTSPIHIAWPITPDCSTLGFNTNSDLERDLGRRVFESASAVDYSASTLW